MAKRFTDSGKWNKPFLRALKAPYKLLWLYILDECDHAGIWQVDIDVAQIKIGERIKTEDALKFLQGKVEPFDNGQKWFIPDFIEFQYGVLDPKNRVHNSVIKNLTRYNLVTEQGAIKPLTSPLQGAKDKDMVKEKEQDKDEGGVGEVRELSTFELCRNYWLNHFHPGFDFNAVSGQKLKSIISKIEKIMKVGGREINTNTVLESFRYICEKLPDWYKDKDLQTIDSKFNEIIEQIKKGKNGQSRNTFQQHFDAANQAIDNIVARGKLDKGPVGQGNISG